MAAGRIKWEWGYLVLGLGLRGEAMESEWNPEEYAIEFVDRQNQPLPSTAVAPTPALPEAPSEFLAAPSEVGIEALYQERLRYDPLARAIAYARHLFPSPVRNPPLEKKALPSTLLTWTEGIISRPAEGRTSSPLPQEEVPWPSQVTPITPVPSTQVPSLLSLKDVLSRKLQDKLIILKVFDVLCSEHQGEAKRTDEKYERWCDFNEQRSALEDPDKRSLSAALPLGPPLVSDWLNYALLSRWAFLQKTAAVFCRWVQEVDPTERETVQWSLAYHLSLLSKQLPPICRHAQFHLSTLKKLGHILQTEIEIYHLYQRKKGSRDMESPWTLPIFQYDAFLNFKSAFTVLAQKNFRWWPLLTSLNGVLHSILMRLREIHSKYENISLPTASKKRKPHQGHFVDCHPSDNPSAATWRTSPPIEGTASFSIKTPPQRLTRLPKKPRGEGRHGS